MHVLFGAGVCAYLCVFLHACVCVYFSMPVMCVCVYVCVCVSLHACCVCVSVYVCIDESRWDCVITPGRALSCEMQGLVSLNSRKME